MLRSVLLILLVVFTGVENGWAGVAILRPHRSENSLISAGGLDGDLLAKLVLEGTNRFRVSRGLKPLVAYRPLMTAAEDHAEAMADNNFLSHQNSRDPSQRTLTDRIRRVGLRPQAYAENIAMNYSTDYRAMLAWSKKGRKTKMPSVPDQTYRTLARSVVDQWINSRGHRENMLGKYYTRLGLGFATAPDPTGCLRVYCVQTFSAPDLSVN